MTEERKAEIVADIVEAFRNKGLSPCFRSYGDGKITACAIGAVTKPLGRICQFNKRYGVTSVLTEGVAWGFDDDELIEDSDEDTRAGYDVGRRIRLALLGGDS